MERTLATTPGPRLARDLPLVRNRRAYGPSESGQHIVVHRFHRSGHKCATRLYEQRQHCGLLQQMLDFDRDIVGDGGKLTGKHPEDTFRMADPIEEVRVAEGDVPRAGSNLGAHVCDTTSGATTRKRPS